MMIVMQSTRDGKSATAIGPFESRGDAIDHARTMTRKFPDWIYSLHSLVPPAPVSNEQKS